MKETNWMGSDAALLTDLYELTMLQAYWREEMHEQSVFSLFSRRVPPGRNYLLAAGLADALQMIDRLRFTDAHMEYLSTLGYFRDEFLRWLKDFRFTGDIYAMPEGTPFFADEPVLEVVAPIDQAQLLETLIMNQIHFQTVLASKAARVVAAAQGRTVVDFGLRRMFGSDAGVKAARAFHIAGVDATSNVLAGYVYGVPVSGTMAHSYIQAHDLERDSFKAFAELYPETILLVDTYDTLEGVRKVIELAGELGEAFKIRGIRLDSGDLAKLAFASREILDDAGLHQVAIFASGSLDEFKIAELVKQSVPITGFGVGTKMGVSEDDPSLDMAYKLTHYDGKGRLKTSSGKKILPGKKQVFRLEENGRAVRDIIAGADEEQPGRPLLRKIMERGRVLDPGLSSPDEARTLARREGKRLPDRVRGLSPADPPYEVVVSDKLLAEQEEIIKKMQGKDGADSTG